MTARGDRPVTPLEAKRSRTSSVPAVVLQVFNELLAERFNEHEIVIAQEEVVARICARSSFERQEIFAKHWLDVEGIYREAGWEVEYDKPGYCESYEASFKFKFKPKCEVKP